MSSSGKGKLICRLFILRLEILRFAQDDRGRFRMTKGSGKAVILNAVKNLRPLGKKNIILGDTKNLENDR